MVSLREFIDTTNIIFLSLLLFIALIDNILIFLVIRHKPLLDNEYINFHRRHGFVKITLLKIIGRKL